MASRVRRLHRLHSPDLGRVDVIRDREGLKLLVDGALYAVRCDRPEKTPTPWLLLAAAPLLSPERRGGAPPHIAILGYGGGTMARLLLAAIPGVRITGLEPDSAVRRAARSELGSDVRGVRLIAECAETFLERTGDRFDAILDDVYAPVDGRLGRPEAGVRLPALARHRLKPGGVYAVNLISPPTKRERATSEHVAASFRCGASVATREFAHRVVIGSGTPILRGAIPLALRRLLAPAGAKPARLTPAALGVASVRLIRSSKRSRG